MELRLNLLLIWDARSRILATSGVRANVCI